MDDDALLAAFTESRLPSEAWTHRAHLRVAWLFLRTGSLDEAHVLLRVGIIRLNAVHGLVETASRGYHETLTRAWLRLVAAARRDGGDASSEAFLERCAARLDRQAVLAHYSRERITSVAARAVFVEPDLAPLPE